MADTISLLPPTPAQGVSQPQASGNATSGGTVVSPKLPVGTVLSGFVVNRDASGNPVLRTENGDVVFSSQFFLKIGSEVTIRLENQGGNLATHVLTVNGQPPQVAAEESGFADTPEVTLGGSLGTQQAVSTGAASQVADGAQEPLVNVIGTLISAPQSPGVQSLPVGTQLTFKITALVQAPEEIIAAATTAAAPSGNAANPALYAAYQRATGAPAPAAAPVVDDVQVTAPVVQSGPVAVSAPQTQATVAPTAAVQAAAVIQAPEIQTAAPVQTVVVTTPAAVAPVAVAPASVAAVEPVVTQVTAPAAATPAAVPAAGVPVNPQVQTVTPAVVTTAVPAPTPQVQTSAPAAPPAAAAAPATTPAVVQAAVRVVSTAPAPEQGAAPAPQAPVVAPQSPLRAAIMSAFTGQPAATTQTEAPSVPQIQAGQTVTGVVIGQQPTGEVLLQTQSGIVRLQPGVSLPQGSLVTAEITDVTQPASLQQVASVPGPPVGIAELAREWTSLQQIVTLLQTGAAQAGGPPPQIPALLTAVAPNTPLLAQNMTAGLMVFVAALTAGDFQGWVGRSNIQSLQDQGYGELVKRADAEFGLIARQFADVAPHQWQPLFFPVAVDGQWQQVRLFVKRDKKKAADPKAKAGEDTRFVVEVNLSQMGQMQMDGFVRHNEKAVNFDLFIRSLMPLSQDIQNNILAIYNSTGELTGYKGTLLFQSVKEFPVNPMEEIMTKASKSVMV